MTQAELQKLVENISQTYFHRPFIHQVVINTRMRTTGGRYHLDDHHIEINAHFLVAQYHAALIGIIKHELVHYHLHLLNLGYRHRDRDFKILLKKVGGSRYAPDIGLRRNRQKQFNYYYRCQNCQTIYPRIRRINVNRYRCSRCGRNLMLIRQYK